MDNISKSSLKAEKIKILNKSNVDSNTHNLIFSYLLKKDEVTLESLLEEIDNHRYSSSKVISVILKIMIENGISLDLKEYGTYNTMYIYDNFKKLRDNKIIDMLKNKINYELKNINSSEFILLMEKLYYRDVKFREFFLIHFNTDSSFQIAPIPDEDLIQREIYIFIFFYFKFKADESKYKLDFSSNYLTGENIFRLLDPIRYLDQVKHLDLSSNKISYLGMYSLGNVLYFNYKILELDISNNFLNDHSLFLFLVGMGYYQIQNKCNDKIKEITEKEFLKDNKYQKTGLYLNGSIDNIVDSNFKKNFDFKSQQHSLTNLSNNMLVKLNLSNNLDIKNGSLILDVIKCSPFLKFLNISRCNLGPSIEDILNYIKDSSACHPKADIITCDMYNNFKIESKLEYLLISNTMISERGINILGEILSSNKCKIRTVTLSDNKLNNYDLTYFFSKLKNSECLEEIYFKECDISVEKEGVQTEFLNFIQNCKNLKNLNLYFNNLDSQSLFMKLLEAINLRNNPIKVLDYSKNNVNFSTEFKDNENAVVKELIKMGDRKVEIIDISLNIKNITNVSIEFMEKIAELQEKIKIIY